MRHPTVGALGADWKTVRLLVFGLDDQFRFLARQTFRKLGVREVVSFSEPADTPGLLARGADLILIDLGAKPESGLAVIERLRRPAGNPFDAVPILVVAHFAQKDMIERAKALGVEGVIPKPISGHELSHRVTDTLANPQRLPIPVMAVAKPKMNFVKEPDPLPDLSVKGEAAPLATRPAAAAEPIPEVAALAARLAARDDSVKPAPANPERPGRDGPWTETAEVAAPAAKPAPRPTAPPAAAPAAAPAAPPRPTHGGGSPVEARRPTGGKLDLDDLAPAAKPRDTSVGFEVAGVKPDLDAEAKRRMAEKRRQQWKEAMEKSGHKARKGGDVASLDLTAVIAEHGLWLQSKGAEGKRATFIGMDLAGADLSNAILANATFREVNLSDACLAEARLDGSDFRYAVLEAADLGSANLGVAAMRHARLQLSNMENAVLRGSDLSGAILTGARMAGADLKGATLIGADLREVDLSKVDGLTSGQIEKSLCDMSTRLPPGVFRPSKTGD
ncbi:MAG: pentapeptide repeat-containing protein [Phaeospirillum sp.]|nr:pentapeptide repeat-containing protein [Phaeospirillum sp.]